MSVSGLIRRYWPETLLIVLVTLPWLSLLALGLVWLWQGGRVAIWALAAAALLAATMSGCAWIERPRKWDGCALLGAAAGVDRILKTAAFL